MKKVSAGKKFREALQTDKPLQVAGVINAYCAKLAEHAGFKAIYLSGSGVATASYGLPDLGITNSSDVLEDVRRITNTTDLPLIVDVDTGWGTVFNIQRTVKELINAGAAGLHIEDQVQAKRCGHRPGKQVVESQEMVNRIKAAVDARSDSEFVIIARTDAFAIEGMDGVLERAQAYIEAGADMIFADALTTLEHYQQLGSVISVPILANITEFGVTPLFTLEQLRSVDVGCILYPLSAFRAMSKAALTVYQTILEKGTQESLLPMMQTRDELYKILHYYEYEETLDRLQIKE